MQWISFGFVTTERNEKARAWGVAPANPDRIEGFEGRVRLECFRDDGMQFRRVGKSIGIISLHHVRRWHSVWQIPT